MAFPWSLRDSKSPEVSRTPLSILAELNNAVIYMISARPTLPALLPSLWRWPKRAPITIGITVTFMLHKYSCHIFFLWFSLCGPPGQRNQLFNRFFLFLFIYLFLLIKLGLVWPRFGDLFVFRNPRELFAYHSRGRSMDKFQSLVRFPVDPFLHPVVSSIVPF